LYFPDFLLELDQAGVKASYSAPLNDNDYWLTPIVW
jgi:hypothetical protein